MAKRATARGRHAPSRLAAVALAITVITACADDTDRPVAYPFTTREVRREPCPESRFECVTITVPRDHFSSGGETWEVTYAIQPAAAERLGTFVTITGGPGSGGIYSADSYTDVMSPLITDHYDIVFLNQRGSGPGQTVRCDRAAAEFGRAPLDTDVPGAAHAIEALLSRFVDECIDEGDIDVDDLPYYGTRQAAEDLELVRQHLGADQLALYGESYGTQFVQTYGAAHPERVEVLIVDGVVDLTIDGMQWYDEAARAHDDALVRTFHACDADPACSDDAGAGGDMAAAFDEFAARLDDAPIEYDLPMPDGTTAARELTRADLDTASVNSVGSFSARMQLLRALNAALNGNVVPLARMSLLDAGLDPETLEVTPDPSWSVALFYAVECQDYSYFPGGGTPRQRLDLWLAEHAAGPTDDLRLGTVALGDLGCLFWPAQPGRVERPEPIVDPPYPTFVMTSDTDPATPMVNAMRVYERLDDAYLVVLQDGPHVIFDWGYECVDDLLAGYLGEGTLPATRITICDGDLIDPYVPIAPDDPGEVAALDDDPVAAARSIEAQVLNHVEFLYWPGTEPLEFGCDFGGAARYSPDDTGYAITLDACELSDGYPISGDAHLAFDDVGTFELTVTTPSGELTSTDDGTEIAVTGTWDGDEVDTTAPSVATDA